VVELEFVTYSNDAKTANVGVPSSLLKNTVPVSKGGRELAMPRAAMWHTATAKILWVSVTELPVLAVGQTISQLGNVHMAVFHSGGMNPNMFCTAIQN